MQEEGIDFYMMPTADFHNSEYVNDYFKVREYFSNFTGSNGTLGSLEGRRRTVDRRQIFHPGRGRIGRDEP